MYEYYECELCQASIIPNKSWKSIHKQSCDDYNFSIQFMYLKHLNNNVHLNILHFTEMRKWNVAGAITKSKCCNILTKYAVPSIQRM